MRFSTFLLAPIMAAVAIPQPNEDQKATEVAKLKELLQRIQNRSPQASPAPGGTGLGSAYGDLTTLLSGLSDTLTATCNLRQDVAVVEGELSSLGL